MADIVDTATRSRMMSGIRGANTKPEQRVRLALHRAGFRYRLHVRGLPGKPDVVLPKYKAVILIHGCYWHRHEGCRLTTTPSTNPEFWSKKFGENVARDQRNVIGLRELGYRVAVVWECAVRRMSDDELAKRLGDWLRSNATEYELPESSILQ